MQDRDCGEEMSRLAHGLQTLTLGIAQSLRALTAGDLPEERRQQLREGISRAWAETSVLSDDEAARQSALRQIDATLGDEHSTRIARLRSGPPSN